MGFGNGHVARIDKPQRFAAGGYPNAARCLTLGDRLWSAGSTGVGPMTVCCELQRYDVSFRKGSVPPLDFKSAPAACSTPGRHLGDPAQDTVTVSLMTGPVDLLPDERRSPCVAFADSDSKIALGPTPVAASKRRLRWATIAGRRFRPGPGARPTRSGRYR